MISELRLFSGHPGFYFLLGPRRLVLWRARCCVRRGVCACVQPRAAPPLLHPQRLTPQTSSSGRSPSDFWPGLTDGEHKEEETGRACVHCPDLSSGPRHCWRSLLVTKGCRHTRLTRAAPSSGGWTAEIRLPPLEVEGPPPGADCSLCPHVAGGPGALWVSREGTDPTCGGSTVMIPSPPKGSPPNTITPGARISR